MLVEEACPSQGVTLWGRTPSGLRARVRLTRCELTTAAINIERQRHRNLGDRARD